MTCRVSGFYASGDGNLNDGRATGFDAIVPNQQFAGGGLPRQSRRWPIAA